MSLLRKLRKQRAATAEEIREAAADARPVATREGFKAARVARLAAESRNRDERFVKEHGEDAVRNSEDLERILALPYRPVPTEEGFEMMRREMTARLSNGRARGDGCLCHELNPAMYDGTPGSACITDLRDIQAWYLYEAALVQGCLGPIAVGSGKTGIDILVAMVVPDCREAVLLLPNTLKPQFLADFRLWAQHFQVPNLGGGEPGAGPNGEYVQGRPVLHVLKYSELSSPRFSQWFEARPDITVVIADEAQALKDRTAVRVGRFLDHFLNKPDTRFFCHTGSLTSRGIEDYSHLAALSLRECSPVPIEPSVVTAWGKALNPTRPGVEPAPPGALLRLCKPGETVYQGFARRFIETAGVVATFEGSLTGVELIVAEREPPPMPQEVKDALAMVRSKKTRPDGEKTDDALEAAMWAREVACGFFMYWNFPGIPPEEFAEPDGLIPRWYRARKAWNKEVRAALDGPRVPNMDSEGLLKEAARRHVAGYRGLKTTWASKTWEAWSAIEKTVPHETKTKWLSDWLARDAAAWMLEQEAKGKPGIVWVENPALGHLVAKAAGRPYYGRGDEAAIGIRAERGDRSVVASIKAHHRGRNLQAFSANLVMQPPADAGIWEQLIGRTHRSLQKASVVTVELYLHVTELESAFDIALGRAGYVKGTTLSDQKLLAGLSKAAG
jgi:hypothetical protein